MNIQAAQATFEVGEASYTIAPLTDQSYQELTHWIRGDFMASTYLAQDTMKPVDAEKFGRLMMKATFELDWLCPEGLIAVQTPRGQAELLYLSMRPTTAGINRTKCADLLVNEEFAAKFKATFGMVNDIDSREVAEDVPPKKTEDV